MSNTTKKRWGDRKDARWIRDMDSLHVIFAASDETTARMPRSTSTWNST